ncbi:MAG: hypothetical protein IT581_10095 [Verrucomicrobiales bacterium]|nr:hypothetical protein [Verrucomicrobiales bacterium]
MPRRSFLLGTLLLPGLMSARHAIGAASRAKSQGLAHCILGDSELSEVLDRAKSLLKSGLNAGDGYGEVWIRDLNTFIELSLQVNEAGPIRDALLNFFRFQGASGDIVDGFIPQAKAGVGYKYRKSELAPSFLAHKNTVETDQESSLVQAVAKYCRVTGDQSLLDETVAGITVRERLGRAMEYLIRDRMEPSRQLLWGATTVDWGDVQPEHEWGVELDEHSHRSIDIYDNAMWIVALDELASLPGQTRVAAKRWGRLRDTTRAQVRRHLWDAKRRKFVPHLYLEGSPFPTEFDEQAVWYHGGTAVAIEGGVLRRTEIKASLDSMRDNVRRAGASSIGLTVYPVYPDGFFKNKGMRAWSYQNGGDWCWFGGRMVQQLIRYGWVEEAYTELKPMVSRVLKHNGFFEWWTRTNEPRGSGKFRGSAGVLGRAIEMLREWATARV